ncbi:MAG: phosphoglycerate dehydrogenase, partial [Endozoicomonadaceae bacterium]|nr:phosphoglycerate dehydrogenase [Endozoicomonadaceae bacterium]
FLLLEGIHHSAVDYLKKSGYQNVTTLPHTLSDSELKKELQDTHFIGVRSRTQINESLLSHAPKLLGIGCFCIGFDQINLDATAQKGIPVFNAPYSNTRSVAELVLAQAILLCRSILEKNNQMHQGLWKKNAINAFEIRGKKLGIVGYGNIGIQLSVLAESFGLSVCYYDTATKLPIGNAMPKTSLKALLQDSDIISLHVPDHRETHNLINAETLGYMKKNAVLINASRGLTVDLEALADALKTNQIMGAAIDVFPEEPQTSQAPFQSPLQNIPNVLLTPHIGGSTQEAQANIAIEVTEKLITFCDNGSTLTSLNFPEVSLPDHPENYRILHIHDNTPGAMARINELFSSHNMNINAQFLQTKNTIGYVVTDVSKAKHTEIITYIKKLSALPGTIRARLLH